MLLVLPFLCYGIVKDYPVFKAARGLRQGDPLSPYLFELCMEELSLLIQKRVMRKERSPIKVSNNGSGISHFLFGDDILLFSTENFLQAKVIGHTMLEFCNAARMVVNRQKSRVFLSSSVSRRCKRG